MGVCVCAFCKNACVSILKRTHFLKLISFSDTEQGCKRALSTLWHILGKSVAPIIQTHKDNSVGIVEASGPTQEKEKIHTHGFSYCMAVCVCVCLCIPMGSDYYHRD